jgi:hypothetical protein
VAGDGNALHAIDQGAQTFDRRFVNDGCYHRFQSQ